MSDSDAALPSMNDHADALHPVALPDSPIANPVRRKRAELGPNASGADVALGVMADEAARQKQTNTYFSNPKNRK